MKSNLLTLIILTIYIGIYGQSNYNYEQAYGFAFQDKGTFYKISNDDRTTVGSFNDHAVIANIENNGEATKWKSLKNNIGGSQSIITDIYTDILNSRSTITGLCTDCVAGRKGQVAFLAVVDNNYNFISVNGKSIYYFFPTVDSFQVRDNAKLLALGNLVYIAYSGDSGFGTDIYLHALNGQDFSQRWRKQYNTNFFETPVMLEFENLNIALGLHGWGKSRILKISEKDGAIIKQFDFTDIPAQFASMGSGKYAMVYNTNDSLRVSTVDSAGKENYISFFKLNTTSTLSYAITANSNMIAVATIYQVVEELPYWLINNRVYFFDTRLQNSKPVQVIIPENATLGRNIRQIKGTRESDFVLIGDRPGDGDGRAFYFRMDNRLFKPTAPATWYNSNYCIDSLLVEKQSSKTYPHTLPLIQNNVVYATKPNFQNKQVSLWMDIYRPYDHYAKDSKDKRPALVYVHGGGYVFGNEDGAGSVLLRAAQHGMMAIGVKYRIGYLPPLNNPDSLQSLFKNGIQNTYRALQDVRDAVKWIYDHADEYYIDKSKIFIAGHSAGGNAVLNYSYLEEKDFVASIVNPLGKLTAKVPVAGIVSVAGPLNLMIESIKSPLDYIQLSENEPLYLIHGTCDSTAYYDHGSLTDPNSTTSVGAYPIACRKQSLKQPYHFTTVKGGGHGLDDVEEQVLGSVLKWIKKEVSCGTTINACELFTVPNTAPCSTLPTCPSCTATPIISDSYSDIKVFPNPFTSTLHIDIGNQFVRKVTIEINDILGKKMTVHYTTSITDHLLELQVNDFKPGHYLISIYDDKYRVMTKKIIKL